jgi:hypothetical protein
MFGFASRQPPRLRPYVPQDNLVDIHLRFARTILKKLTLLHMHSKQAESVGAWLEGTNNPMHVEQHAQINFARCTGLEPAKHLGNRYKDVFYTASDAAHDSRFLQVIKQGSWQG